MIGTPLNLTPNILNKILLKLGFYIHHQTGGCINLRYNAKKHLRIVIPFRNRDLALKNIEINFKPS